MLQEIEGFNKRDLKRRRFENDPAFNPVSRSGKGTVAMVPIPPLLRGEEPRPQQIPRPGIEWLQVPDGNNTTYEKSSGGASDYSGKPSQRMPPLAAEGAAQLRGVA